jgi:predicted nucleotidyltransferase
MTVPRDILAETPALSQWAILGGYRGSIAHGTYTPDNIDDKDVMYFCVPPIRYYTGLRQFGSRGTLEIKRAEWDIVIYEARKAISLLAQGNPNVLCMLWLSDKHRLCMTEAGSLLLSRRGLFVGKHVYHSFVGYAKGQLHRMTHGAHEGYMGERRKTLVAQFGYDTKNAAHLIRLLRMGIEFLTDGVLRIEREDASELLDIKRGHWTLERVKEESDRLFALAQEAFVRSPLPAEPDRDAIDILCQEVVRRAWEERSDD